MESAVNMDLACAALSAALANRMAVIRYMANRNKDKNTNKTNWTHSQVSKAQKPRDPYEGLAQCFRNVTNCNVAYKPKFCL